MEKRVFISDNLWQVLKEIQPGVWIHSHWVDDEGNVLEIETDSEALSETELLRKEIADIKEQNYILMEALADIGGVL